METQFSMITRFTFMQQNCDFQTKVSPSKCYYSDARIHFSQPSNTFQAGKKGKKLTVGFTSALSLSHAKVAQCVQQE